MNTCTLCGNRITDDQDTAKEVSGWVGGPKKDSMRLRKDTGRIAHEACVLTMAAGQDPTQPDLFALGNRVEVAASKNTATVDNVEDLI